MNTLSVFREHSEVAGYMPQNQGNHQEQVISMYYNIYVHEDLSTLYNKSRQKEL